MVDQYEMAVALICPVGHREATLKSHWAENPSLTTGCGRCGLQMKIEREALVRVREMDESVYKRVRHPR